MTELIKLFFLSQLIERRLSRHRSTFYLNSINNLLITNFKYFFERLWKGKVHLNYDKSSMIRQYHLT